MTLNISMCYFPVYGGDNSLLGVFTFVFYVFVSEWYAVSAWFFFFFYIFLVCNVFNVRSNIESFLICFFVFVVIFSLFFVVSISNEIIGFIRDNNDLVSSFIPLSFFNDSVQYFKFAWTPSETSRFYDVAGAHYQEYLRYMHKENIIKMSRNDINLLEFNMEKAFEGLPNRSLYNYGKYLVENKNQFYLDKMQRPIDYQKYRW